MTIAIKMMITSKTEGELGLNNEVIDNDAHVDDGECGGELTLRSFWIPVGDEVAVFRRGAFELTILKLFTKQC